MADVGVVEFWAETAATARGSNRVVICMARSRECETTGKGKNADEEGSKPTLDVGEADTYAALDRRFRQLARRKVVDDEWLRG